MTRLKYSFTHLATVLFLMGVSLTGYSPASAQQASALKGHDTTQALDVEADQIRLKQKKGQAFMTGSVKVSQGKLTLTAEEIVVFYDTEEGFGNPSVQRLDATGGVKLVSPSETVSSEWAVYDVEKRIVTLGGKVAYTGVDAAIKGERLELNLLTGLVKLDGEVQDGDQRVKGHFKVPDSENN